VSKFCLNLSGFSSFLDVFRNIADFTMAVNAKWLLSMSLVVVYERKENKQVYYVLPIEYFLGKLPVVPVGDTGTIPFSMRHHAEYVVDASFDSRVGAAGGGMSTQMHSAGHGRSKARTRP
jgi:hypothetical protein